MMATDNELAEVPAATPPRPACFVAMPFGRKAPPGLREPEVFFDEVWAVMERAIAAEQLEAVRADVEPGGGFIHRSMYERLMVAEYVIADLTFANANVTYEVGVRHGTSDRPTILVGAEEHLGGLPFDFAPLRVLPYQLRPDGHLSQAQAAQLESALRQRLRDARSARGRTDNPIMQVTSWRGGRLEHDKTDVFLARAEYAGEIGKRIEAALQRSDATEAVAELHRIEQQLCSSSEIVAQLHTALMSIYLGYRKHKAWERMVELFDRLPPELRSTAVAQEQLALALNRLAEKAATSVEVPKEQGEAEAAASARVAADLRRRALDAADLPAELVSAETWGIRGRIYKGWYEAERAAGRPQQAEAALAKAIEAYEAGVAADMRDYYPGVNAVTLRLVRSAPEDLAALERLVPVVRMAADVAPRARSHDERYWRTATKLELASAARDFDAARVHLTEITQMMGIGIDRWMYETTIDNLRIHQEAFSDDPEAVAAVSDLIRGLDA